MADEIHISVEVLRLDFKTTRECYDRTKTYESALALQKAKRALQAFFKSERNHFHLIVNPNEPRPAKSKWTHARVIEGNHEETFQSA